MSHDAPLVEFRNLTVYRDERLVLDRFSLVIPHGQNVAFLGPNGSGKSTLLKLVTREVFPLVEPGASLRVLGRDRWLLFELREHLGIVTNDLMTACTREMTGRELVLSAEHREVQWLGHDAAVRQLRFDSNRVTLWELRERLCPGPRHKRTAFP